MIIKVCGMRKPENIRSVSELGIDMIGFVFKKKSPRYVFSIPSKAGLLPDYASISDNLTEGAASPARVGVFINEMPQNIITMAYNYKLDYIQMHGTNDHIMIDNLRRTIGKDIRPNIKFIKAIGISDRSDFDKWREYSGVADMLLFYNKGDDGSGNDNKFDWSLLDSYDGNIPFLISGGIGPEDAENILALKHPKMAGIDISSRFECSTAVKDVNMLSQFISKIRNI